MSAGFGLYVRPGLFAGGPSISLSLGAQLNDRWALLAQAAVHSIVFVGHDQAALVAEWSAEHSTITLSFGAGIAHSYVLVGPPCACPLPREVAVTIPLEVGLNAHRRTTADVHRSGFRFALQLSPTVVVYRQNSASSEFPLGGLIALQFGWALR